MEDILEQEFAQFSYPHTLVTDNALTFTPDDFQEWCRNRGITHLCGAPYHPITNGDAERLVQSFKQSAQGKQAQQASKSQQNEKSTSVNATSHKYLVGAPFYALYFGPKRNKNP